MKEKKRVKYLNQLSVMIHLSLFMFLFLIYLLVAPVWSVMAQSPTNSIDSSFVVMSVNANLTGPLSINASHGSKSNLEIAQHQIYLPMITTPFIVEGEIRLIGERTRDVTTFRPMARLDLTTGLYFSAQPVEMRLWRSDQVEPGGWEPYSTNQTVLLNESSYGAQTINARFRTFSGASSSLQQVVLFYVPNGDFLNSEPTGWQLAGQLGHSIGNGRLRLGDPNHPCFTVPLAATIASINFQLPQSNDYQLRIEGTVFTYDQNPQNNSTYDAFEVFINNSLFHRISNQAVPLDCNLLRTIDVDLVAPLANHSDQVVLRLENHNRFDNLLNTYTDITAVWIEATP